MLVIPGSLFLIYLKRNQLTQQPFIANYWLFFPLVGTLILYTFGLVGDIRLFMHIATFVSLPLIIWLVVGNCRAKIITFPLYFILFSIPVGEQFIPYLQELTTDLAVPLLEFTGVPIYRNGLYLDIPEGRFLVAEACSGISFLIASIVFGNLYAYLSFHSLSKQLLFVFISIIVPILANALRVYGIILTAHLTDMEYAAGADHLIYGGVFYTIILFLLIFIGEKFRDKDIIHKIPLTSIISENNSGRAIGVITSAIITVFILQFSWLKSIKNSKATVESSYSINSVSLFSNSVKTELVDWQPNFQQASETHQGTILVSEKASIEFFIASYIDGTGELISSLNKLYDADRWTLISVSNLKIESFAQSVQLTHLVSPNGKKRIIIHWYQLGSESFAIQTIAKLYRTVRVMLGVKEPSSVIAFSLEVNERLSIDDQTLIRFLESNSRNMKEIFSEINN